MHSTNRFSFTFLTLLMACLIALQLAGCSHKGKAGNGKGLSSAMQAEADRVDELIVESKSRKYTPDSSLALLAKARNLAVKDSFEDKLAMVWALMAATNVHKGDIKVCKAYIDSSFVLANKLKDGELLCFLHSVAAGMYQYSSDYAKAASHYFQALDVKQEYKLENTAVLPSLYNNLGSFMILLGEKELSQKYMELAKDYALKMKPVDSASLTYILVNLGQTYMDSDSNASTGYFRTAFDMAQKRNDALFAHRIVINLARVYMDKKNYDSSGYFLELSRQYAVTPPDVAETETYTGFWYLYQHQGKTALIHLEKALQLAEENTYESLDQIYQGLAAAHASLDQNDKAYKYQLKYSELTEKKMEEGQQSVVDFMLSFHNMEQEKRIQEKQLQLQAKERAIKERNAWIIAMCIFCVLLCFVLLMSYRNYKNRRVLANERMLALVRQQEIEKLKAEATGADKERARIAYDLHDGVMVRLANVKMNLNFLQGLYPGFSESSHYKDIIRQFDIASGELRNTAHNLMPEVLLEDGIASAVYYFCKATENASDIKIKFQEVGPALPRLVATVEITIYRVVQELLQNVIRHAQATQVLLQLQYSDNFLSVTVEDNGKGMAETGAQEGFGIKGIRNRLKMLSGSVDIESEAGKGTTVYLELDVRPHRL